MRTKRSTVQGLGSAKEGSGHFWHQRLSGVVNLVLGLYLIITIAHLMGKDFGALKLYFSKPWHMALMSAFILSAAYHMKLGLQVVIEDYVHGESSKVIWLALNGFVAGFAALIGIFSILKLGLGA